MKKLIVLLCLVLTTVIGFAQRTLVAPVNPSRIFPVWVGGDRDFYGHGPRVSGDIHVVVTEGKGQLLAFINLRLEETEGDHSLATIDETRVIYNAPAGKQIRSVIVPGSLNSHIDYKLPAGGMNRVNVARGGPVNYLMVNGDTGGSDIGNNTDDDSYVSVFFAGMVIELEPIPADMRELTLPKRTIATMIQAKLAGTKGKLNTYGPRHGDSWFKDHDSWLKFPDAIRRDTMFFSQLQEVLISPRRYNYNDINLTNIRGDVNGQYLRLNVNWESDGPEFRGECVNDIGCGFGSPSVQLDNLVIKINVRPFVSGGKLQYDPFDIQVEFGFNYSADCGILSALCSEAFKDPVLNAFFQARFTLSNVLADDATRSQIAAALTDGVMAFVHSFGGFPAATQIVEVRDDGANLVVRCR